MVMSLGGLWRRSDWLEAGPDVDKVNHTIDPVLG
jgi:hypothetical protein